MALDSTPSGISADSYLSVADADTLAAELGLVTWAGKTTQEKEVALRTATQDIDSHRIHNPIRYVWNQALQFPRQCDRDGLIPREVKRAVMFQAEFVAVAGQSDQKNWEGVKAAPLSVAGNTSTLCPRAMSQFAKFISRTGRFA